MYVCVQNNVMALAMATQSRNKKSVVAALPSDGVVTVVDVGAGVGVSAGVVEDMLLVVLLPMDSAGS